MILSGELLMIFMGILQVLLTGLYIYGIYLAFNKKWYLGVLALIFSGFGVVLGGAKLFFKEDLLK